MAGFNREISDQAQIDALFAKHFRTIFSESFSSTFDPNDALIDRYTKRTNTELVAVHNDGSISTVEGTNLLNSKASITKVTITNGSEISILDGGSIDVNGSGNLSNFNYRDTASGVQLSAEVSFDTYSFVIHSLEYESNEGMSFSFGGRLTLYNFSTSFTGYMNEFTITLNGQTDTLTNYEVNFVHLTSTDSSYSAFLGLALDNDDHIYTEIVQGTLDGGRGYDTLTVSANEIESARHAKSGGILVETDAGTITISNVEAIITYNGTVHSIETLLSEVPSYTIESTANNNSITPEIYTGPVHYLEFSLIGDETNENIIGSDRNDFMNLLAGDDAANGGAGDDVLDGGTGSNFLTGGGDNDTFFLDGRGGETTWSTITDFSSDEVNIWGWQDGVSRVLLKQIDGADGFKGATLHMDLNGDNEIDTSITLTGVQLDTMPESSALSVAGNGYLLIA